MKEVTCWKSGDGKLFEEKEEVIEYERYRDLCELVDSYLNRADLENTHLIVEGFVNQRSNLVQGFKNIDQKYDSMLDNRIAISPGERFNKLRKDI